MDISLLERDTFTVCGYCAETSLETCGTDLGQLWRNFETKKQALYEAFGAREDFYGLMWKTTGGRYCYLIGIEAADTGKLPFGAVSKSIPPSKYAVASVPSSQSAVDAWTKFYYEALPGAGYIPNAGHGFDFEHYPYGGQADYELWTPVIKKD